MTRIAVAAVSIPIILWLAYQGGYWLYGFVLLISILGMVEFLLGEQYGPNQIPFWLSLIIVALSVTLAARPLLWVTTIDATVQDTALFFHALSPLVIMFLISGMIASLKRAEAAEIFRQHSRLIWCTSYAALLYPYVFLLGYFPTQFTIAAFTGGDCLLFLFGVLWVGDTLAMWIGKGFGRNKLAPTVSPNKTIEGFFGGLLGAFLVGVVMYFWKFQALALHHVLFMAIGASVFGQLGDLVESMWKRSVGRKDSSHLIPGHGGVLDRFDSLMFAAPFMYGYLIVLLT